MRLIFFFDGLQFGGIERVGVEYIKLLHYRGHHITVINLKPSLDALEKELPDGVKILRIHYPRNLTPFRYGKLKREGIVGLAVYTCIKAILFLANIIYRPFYSNRLKPLYKTSSPDVAIAFSGHVNDLTFTAYNMKSHGKKTVAWLHGSQYSYDEINPCFYELYSKMGNLVCLSEKDDEKGAIAFNQDHGIKKVKIYNPVNLAGREISTAKVNELKTLYGDFILMIGRLAKDKDQATLIKAIKVLNTKYNLHKNLILVGDGTERERLEVLARSEGISDQVIFTGAKYDVQNYYSAACVYAHSSPAEGLPTVLLEAMYYKVPIASTNSEPGVEEILQDKCGLVSPVGDAEALADNIYNLYTDKGLSNKLVSASQERIKDFMPDHVIQQFEEFMSE